MVRFEDFERDLQKTLAHMYDPDLKSSQALCQVIGCDADLGPDVLRRSIISAVEAMRPESDIPRSARIQRIYEVLVCRYLQGLTQEETAERLGITPRHLRREQQEAVRFLAKRLWDQATTRTPGQSPDNGPEFSGAGAASESWRTQLRHELSSLYKTSSTHVADVSDALSSACQVVKVLADQRGVDLKLSSSAFPLPAAIHPAALQQTLVTAITDLIRAMPRGQVHLSAERQDRLVGITIKGTPVDSAGQQPDATVIRELLATDGGSVTYRVENDGLSICLALAAANRVVVLVIDDNADLVHFYRRYTAGTRYWISNVAGGKDALQALRATRPDIIVLDIMLPDVDGWALLQQLRQSPAAKDVPIVVCSVIREKELALALGANVYVSKPVHRQEFLQALDQALSLAS